MKICPDVVAVNSSDGKVHVLSKWPLPYALPPNKEQMVSSDCLLMRQ